jgi:NAD(P)-dependent dehydrogenase (short-subunit alcohol dehydrogenase family)
MGSSDTLARDAGAKRVVLVTGAAGRLGGALCEAYARSSDVVAVYRNDEPKVASQLQRPIPPAQDEAPGDVYCVQADLNDRSDVRRLVEVALARYGRIDVVINSAADIRFHGRLSELVYQGEESARQLITNAFAPVYLVSAVFQSCWKHDVAANRRCNRNLVNVSSQSALYASQSQGQGLYGASKAALNLLTLYQALEMEPYGIRANVICPGTFRDAPSTQRVVAAIERLTRGTKSGEIITKY